MKNIISIFKDDVKGLTTNFLALAIALGLCALPSLYAWFNIYSNWDPYANTQNVPIAVVSEDEGFTKSDGTFINMGKEVLESLESNDKLGWTFVGSSKEAIDGVYSGEYYAALVLAEDFSESMYDCLANDMVHPKIYYYENEKRNAIAVKITDTGSETLQSNINKEFLEVLITVLSENIEELSNEDEESFISQIEKKLTSVNNNLIGYGELIDSFTECNESLAETITDMKTIIPKIRSALYSSINTIGQAQQAVNDVANTTNIAIGTKLNEMAVKATVANNVINVAQAELAKGSSAETSVVSDNLSSASKNLAEISNDANDISKELEQFKGLGFDTEIQQAQKKLGVLSKSASTASEAANKASSTTEKIANANSKLAEINRKIVSAAVDEAVAQLPAVNQRIFAELSSEVNKIAQDTNKSIGEAKTPMYTSLGDMDDIDSVFDGVSLSLVAANQALYSSKVILDATTEKLSNLLEHMNAITDKEEYQSFIELMKNDPTLYGAFFSQPIEVETIPVYETATYGSAVTPFYTTLALWVGGILLVALFKVKAKPKNSYKNATDTELFLGRYLLFFVLGQIQSVICVYGDLHLLNVQCYDTKLFYLIGSVTSFVFTLLIYSITLSFGDVGKALVVVVLVIQIAGSSGTYPIELLPDIFQKIYTYFPFPYSINAMREVISGRYQDNYWMYMGQLLIFAAVAVIIGLLVRLPFKEINHFFEERMEDTEFM